jgi:hypothetical protein
MNEPTTLETDKSVTVLESALANERTPLETGGVLGIPPFQRMGTDNLPTVRQGHIGR